MREGRKMWYELSRMRWEGEVAGDSKETSIKKKKS